MLWCLGKTYGFLGDCYAAYEHLQEACHLFNALLPGDSEMQQLCCHCMIDLVNAMSSTFEDSDMVVSLARDVEKQSATISDDLVHSWSLIVLVLALEKSGHWQEALHHLECAKLMAMGSIYLTDACYWIAIVHYHENRLPEALGAAKEAWKHAELRNSLMDQAQISLVLGMILFSANRDREAWKYIKISLMKNSQFGNQCDGATTLEYMGYGYLQRGDYINAYGAYKAAAENYLGTVDEEPDGTTCKDNMAKIKDKQRNPDLDIGFKRPRMDNDWPSLFYPVVKAFPGDRSD